MKKGEKGILLGLVIFSVVAMAVKGWMTSQDTEEDPGILLYSTASEELAKKASVRSRKYK